MKDLLNQKGYTLLIVLFLVVFIMTVTAVFLRGSLSNAKQEHLVDEKQLSVVAAEMGVEFYTNLFNNHFIEIRKGIWNKEYSIFLEEREKIINDKTIVDKEKKIEDIADYHRYIVYEKVYEELKNVNIISPNEEVIFYFNKKPVITAFSESTSHLYAKISGTVTGEYKNKANLEMVLLLYIPSMIENSLEGEAKPAFDLLKPQHIREINQNLNCVPNQRYQQQDFVKVFCSNTNFSGEQIQQNKSVDIGTNGNLTAKQIEQNYSSFTATSGGLFKSEQIQQNGTVTIQSGGDFSAEQIQQNGGLQIHTNGLFTSQQINDNTNKLTITAINGITAKQIQKNYNSKFKTNKNFSSEQIQQNNGFIKMEVGGDFNSKQIDQNENLEILTLGNFESEQIQHNNSNSLIHVGGQFNSKHIQHNRDIKIIVGSDFYSEQIQGNKGLELYVNNDYKSKHVQQNDNLKIIVRGDFAADKLDLEPNSLVCVGGKFSVGSINKDSSSSIYVLNEKNEFTNNREIILVDSEVWTENCGVKPIDSTINWKEPIIDVEY